MGQAGKIGFRCGTFNLSLIHIYVVLRLADLDALITTHHSLSLELIPVLSEEPWEQHRPLLYITQHIHIERVSHCKAALLSKTCLLYTSRCV